MEISILLLAILSGGGFIGCQVVKIIKSVMADIADVTTGALLLQPQGTRRGRLMRRPCLILALYAVLAGSLPCRAEDPAADRVTITLPEALTAALKNNLDLANAVLETSKSEKGSKIVDRERLPELSLDGRYTRLDTPAASEIPVPGYSFPESEADLAIVATMPLWTGGRLSSASRQASTGADLAKEAERTTRFDLLLDRHRFLRTAGRTETRRDLQGGTREQPPAPGRCRFPPRPGAGGEGGPLQDRAQRRRAGE